MAIPVDKLLHGLCEWIKHDEGARLIFLSDILQHVSFTQCDWQALKELCSKYHSILHETTISEAVEMSGSLSLAIVGGYEQDKLWVMSKDKQFKYIDKIPADLYGNQSSICQHMGTGLILTGGLKKDICAVYHAGTKTWTPLTKLQTDRRMHASVCISEKLMLFGGYVSGEWSTSVECLHLEGEIQEWRQSVPIPVTLEFPKLASLGVKAVLMGHDSPEVFWFDTEEETWTQLPPLPEDPGSYFSLAAGKGSIYCAGGNKSLLYVYDVACETWIKLPSPTQLHQDGALIFHQDILYLLGGWESTKIEEYDTMNDVWKVASYKLPISMQYHFAFLIDTPQE